MTYQLEARIADQMFDIALVACKKIVETDNVVAFGDQAIAKMGAEEASAPSHKNRFSMIHFSILAFSLCNKAQNVRLRRIKLV